MRIPAGMRSESQKDTELNESKWTRQKECNLPARTESRTRWFRIEGSKGLDRTIQLK